MFTINIPETNRKIQVAELDFKNELTWHDAVFSCEQLGEGWRLPTIIELQSILKELHSKGLGSFKSEIYWSISEDEFENDTNYAMYLLFSNGFKMSDSKDWEHYVRAVKSI
jgi:hypothetical protein